MIKIAICEDNTAYAKVISKKVFCFFRNKETEIDISVFSTKEDVESINYSLYDLFLLDIELDNKSGIELGIDIKKSNPKASIIYISAFYTYAISGYKARPLAYILKGDSQFDNNLNDALNDFINEKLFPREFIEFKNKTDRIKVFLDDIVYIESFSRKLVIHFYEKDTFEIYSKISDMENSLNSKGFLRIHKSYLVNMRHVLKISNYLTFTDIGVKLPTSNGKYSEIISSFAIWKCKN